MDELALINDAARAAIGRVLDPPRYGRLVAYLACRARDIAAAEDALSEAVIEALAAWPASGVPGAPDAWLLTVARRRLVDAARRGARFVSIDAEPPDPTRGARGPDVPPSIPDDRLRLMFACAHPAVDEAARAPLLLQSLLGLNAQAIAAAFLVAPAAMGQRLTRAKRRLRELAVSFDLPDDAVELRERLGVVLDALYAGFSAGWGAWDVTGDRAPDNDADGPRGLQSETVRLARLVVDLLPDEPEPRGLLALMLYCVARQPARLDDRGAYVPLADQDPARWDASLIDEAEAHLHAAARHGRPGRFQYEAAIQSAHVGRRDGGPTPWADVLALYQALNRDWPSFGAMLGEAAALIGANRPGDALAALAALPADRVAAHQPYHATRAAALAALGRRAEAVRAFDRAIALCADQPVRDELTKRRDAAADCRP